MPDEATLKTIIERANLQIAARMTMLLAALDEAPVNPAVTQISGRAFTVSSSELMASGRWDVFHHDWPAQYAAIKDHLTNVFQHRSSLTALQSILDTGKERLVAQHCTRDYNPALLLSIRPVLTEVVDGLQLWYGTQKPIEPESSGPGAC
jgi:hypothetical protein